ncbi:metallophosphoesterase [Sphingobacterium sp. FBM7-1]|uniref:metallophosphoesterase n=1 Tax=Sphingobacterium sp. FBM7-1 TaxID=2886688 RepID=UPI001D10D30C|nr:metallophosphoesterase [Sphingobacterium sp. FBM7-1]MCC2599405.1 metallophosphoesterase [Sphingobacterium sp. FBM7-1]
MKKTIQHITLSLCFAATLLSNAFGQVVSNKPQLENKDSWSMIMIPDIQNYVKWGRNQPILELMTAWIEANIDTLNIRMVVCVGDLVQNNEKITNDYDGDQSTQRQWEAASGAFKRLSGKVPFIAATGNHDYSIDREGNRTSRYNEFFKVDDNFLNAKYLVQNARDEQQQQTLANAAYEIKGLGGRDYLFMTMEFAPRDTIVSWAKKVADMPAYKDHRIVLVTHSYLTPKDELGNTPSKWLLWEPYQVDGKILKSGGIMLPNANNGQQLWDKFVQPSSNIDIVLSGHFTGEGYKKGINDHGKSVHQILFDAQAMGGGGRSGNGGDGWLRILEFFPDDATVKVRTFSPLFGISPTTQEHAWKKDARNEYTIELD